jgi:hypothetical protein
MRKPHMAAIVALALASAGAIGFPAIGQAAAPKDSPSASAPENSRERFRDRMRERAAEHRPEVDRKLTSDQVRDIIEGRLAMRGNANLKVGKVAAKEEGVVTVEIVTKTGALVTTQEISTRTGLPARLESARNQRAGDDERGRGRGGMHGGFHGGAHDGMRGGMGGRSVAGGASRDLNLTVDHVKKLAEARLIMAGNPNVKVGAVKEKDADTITVDIVASDNSLVSRHEINRHTGRPNRS